MYIIIVTKTILYVGILLVCKSQSFLHLTYILIEL